MTTFFEKYNSTEEMGMKEITKLAHELYDIKFIVFKNPAMAKSLRESYEKHFEKQNKVKVWKNNDLIKTL